MALKRFRPALADCQAAATLQSSSPSSKTLVRLAKCQLSLGQYAAALSTLRSTLEAEPGAPAAVDLQKKIKVLDGHLAAFEKARRKKEWAMARLSLDQAVRAQEGEGGEIPVAWRLWRVEVELARGGWDAASAAAKSVIKFGAVQHELTFDAVMHSEWSPTRSTSSLPEHGSCSSPASSRKHYNTSWRLSVLILDQSPHSSCGSGSRTSSG
jgi:tetratricopeptide (TPR) repeat protein